MKARSQGARWFGIFVVALVSSEVTFIAVFSAASIIYGVPMQDVVLGVWVLARAWLPLIHVALFLGWVLVRRGAAIGVLEATVAGSVTGLAVAALAIYTPLL